MSEPFRRRRLHDVGYHHGLRVLLTIIINNALNTRNTSYRLPNFPSFAADILSLAATKTSVSGKLARIVSKIKLGYVDRRILTGTPLYAGVPDFLS
jgi:hypothetical protein